MLGKTEICKTIQIPIESDNIWSSFALYVQKERRKNKKKKITMGTVLVEILEDYLKDKKFEVI